MHALIMYVFAVTSVGVSCLLLCGFWSLSRVVRSSYPLDHPASPQLDLRKIMSRLVDCQVYFSNFFLLDFRTDNLYRT